MKDFINSSENSMFSLLRLYIKKEKPNKLAYIDDHYGKIKFNHNMKMTGKRTFLTDFPSKKSDFRPLTESRLIQYTIKIAVQSGKD